MCSCVYIENQRVAEYDPEPNRGIIQPLSGEPLGKDHLNLTMRNQAKTTVTTKY